MATQRQVHTYHLGPETQEMSLGKTTRKFLLNRILPKDSVLDSNVSEDYQPSLENS